MSTVASIFQTVAPTVIAVAFIVWKSWVEYSAANERKAIVARQDAQEKTIKGIQDAIAQCPMAWTTNENGESIWASRKFPRRCCAA